MPPAPVGALVPFLERRYEAAGTEARLHLADGERGSTARRGIPGHIIQDAQMLVIASAIRSKRNTFAALRILLQNDVSAHTKDIQFIDFCHANALPVSYGYLHK